MREVIAVHLLFALTACTPAVAPPPPAAPPLEPASPVAFALPSGAAAMTPNLQRQGEDLLYTWQEAGEAGARLRFARWHAEAWSAPVEVAAAADLLANQADYPTLAVAPDGSLLTHWLQEAADGYTFHLRRSADGGATWTDLPAPYPAGLVGERGFLSYAAAPDGLRIFWLDGRASGQGGGTALHTTRLAGEVLSPEEVVDPRTCDCCGTDAVAGMVLYRDRDEGERRDIVAARPGAAPVPVATDGWTISGCPVNGPAADADGARVAVAWFTGAEDTQSVRVAFSEDGGASFGPAIRAVQATPESRPLGRVDLVLEADGTALVSWLSAEGAPGRVHVRRVAPDGRTGLARELGAVPIARAAGFPRLSTLGERVVAAWTEPDAGVRAVAFDPGWVPAVGGG